jgi:hypothetical protein
MKKITVFLSLLVLLVSFPTGAIADEYNKYEAGNILRVAAYILHPVGTAIDYVVARPLHWLLHQEPMDEIFGHDIDRTIYEKPPK